jgi:hypothetical protein
VTLPEESAFSDEQFMSADEKRKVLRAWTRFLKSGCAEAQFTKDLYHHLSQHCSFIAHFDRHGFYNFYFDRITPDLFRFFEQFDPQRPGISAEYGTTHWLSEHNTGSGLNHAMREAAEPYLEYIYEKLGVVWRKSACRYCPFARITADHIARQKQFPADTALAMVTERLSLAMNQRGQLYKKQPLYQIVLDSGNHAAIEQFNQRMSQLPWAVYRVRRIYKAAPVYLGEGKHRRLVGHDPNKKGTADRCVEIIETLRTADDAIVRLHELAVGRCQLQTRIGCLCSRASRKCKLAPSAFRKAG